MTGTMLAIRQPSVPGRRWDLSVDVPHPKPYPRCVFCGAKADSREHAVPKWIARRLGIKDFLAGGHLGRATRKQPISFASYRARVFCAGCNKHFKHLEDAVIPLLEPMARSRALALGVDSQALLALWGVKTAVALIAANNMENPPDATVVVPAQHRASVRDDGQVSGDVWVGVASWRGTPIISTSEAVLVDRQHGRPGLEAYIVVLAFASIAFKVVGFTSPPPSGHAIGGSNASIVQLWPPAVRMIHWPPPGPSATNMSLGALLNFVPLRRADE